MFWTSFFRTQERVSNQLLRNLGRYTIKIMTMNLELTVADSYEKLEAYREFWTANEWHPDTNLDGYLAWCQAHPEVIRPHVVVLSEGGIPKAMMIGRIEGRRLKVNFGYRTIYQPRLRTLSMLYGGALGDFSEDAWSIFVEHFLQVLKAGEAEAVFFNQIRMDSPLYRLAKSKPPLPCRDLATVPNPHRRLSLVPQYQSYDHFFAAQGDNFQHTTKYLWRKFRRKHGDSISIRRLEERELDDIIAVVESIASKTYHRQMGVGFHDDPATRRTLALAKQKGRLRVYVLFVGETPVAFYTAYKIKEIFMPRDTGYDAAFSTFSPGRLLLLEIIRELMQEGGVEKVDFGFGDSKYKEVICNENWLESSVYIFRPTLKAVAINSIRSTLVLASEAATRVARSLKVEQRIKKLWRGRLLQKSHE